MISPKCSRPRQSLILALFAASVGVLLLAFDFNFASAQSSAQLSLLQSDTNRIVLELQVSGYDVSEQTASGVTYAVVSIPDLGSMGGAGKPQLPIKGAMLGIPPGAQPTLKVLDDQTRHDTLTRPVLPAPAPRIQYDLNQSQPNYLGDVWTRDSAVYSANRLYPSDVARIASTGDWRSQHYIVVEFHPLQYNPVTREVTLHRRIRVEIALNYPGGIRAATLGTSLNEGAFEPVMANALLNYSSAKNWRSTTPPARLSIPQRSTSHGSGPWYKIAVNADGLYRITCNQLPAGINPSTLQLFKQGVELAINVSGTSWAACNPSTHYIEFFGQAAMTKYTDTNVYWLTYGVSTGKRMASRGASGIGSTPATFTDTLHIEENHRYISQSPTVEGFDHWVWNPVSAGNGVPNQYYNFQLNRFVSTEFSATLRVDFIGFNNGDHHTQVFLNGHMISDTTWSGWVEHRGTIAVPQSYLTTTTNTVRVSEPDIINPFDKDAIFTNYFDLGYQSAYTAITDTLKFSQVATGTWEYQITNFGSSAVQALDITDPLNPALFYSTTVSSPCPCTIQFTDSITSPHEYLTTAQYSAPSSITPYTTANLQSPNNTADYIIIAPNNFITRTEPLKTYRKNQGLRVRVVDVQDVYDEFNDGVMDPQAIRNFLIYALGNWNQPRTSDVAPSFALLVGDGTIDPKGYCATLGFCWLGFQTPPNSTVIPPYLRMVTADFNEGTLYAAEVPSDNRLVSSSDSETGMPNMMIGRLPANTVADVEAMVSKITGYEQSPTPGDWQRRMTFVTDAAFTTEGQPNGAGNFWDFSDQVALDPQFLPRQYFANRIYYNPCNVVTCTQYTPLNTSTDVHTAINSSINVGTAIVNYIGHGAASSWSNDSIFTTDDANLLTNGITLPLMLEWTCYTGNFAQLPQPSVGRTNQSLAETMVRTPNKGALADWAGSGLGLAEAHDLLDKGFFDALMQHRVRQLGVAVAMGQQYLWTNGGGSYRDLIDTYILFGDPTSRLNIPNFNYYYFPLIRR